MNWTSQFRLKIIVSHIIIMSLFISLSILTHAAENSSRIPLIFSPELPENQVKGIEGYFHLQVEAGQNQELWIQIKNQNPETTIVLIQPANAITAPNGNIIYVPEEETQAGSIIDTKYEFASVVSVQSVVEMEPNSIQRIPVTITPALLDGTLLGGLLFITEQISSINDTDELQRNATFSISNRFVYAMAIQLDFPGESITKLSLEQAYFELIPSEPRLNMKLKNDSPMIIKNISGEYRVYRDKGSLLFFSKLPSFTMAPKTEMTYPVYWNFETIQSGNYFVELTLNYENNTLEQKKDFSIRTDNIVNYTAEKRIIPKVISSSNLIFFFNKNWIIFVITITVSLIVIWKLNRRNKSYPGSM